jgi:hypothetical protein
MVVKQIGFMGLYLSLIHFLNERRDGVDNRFYVVFGRFWVSISALKLSLLTEGCGGLSSLPPGRFRDGLTQLRTRPLTFIYFSFIIY